MSTEYTPVTQSILCLIFLMCVRTIQSLNYGEHESKKQLAVYDSDTPVYEMVDPKQGYNK